MQTKHLFLLSALAFLACAGLQAQVTIGGMTAPASGAVLDLNSTVKGGLLLSNVSLEDLETIPDTFLGVSGADLDEVKSSFTGAMVYHTGENDIAAGIYVWDGEQWASFGSGCSCPSSTVPGVGAVADYECNCYTTRDFGSVAGVWMTQNLRSTKYSNGRALIEGAGLSSNETDKYYTYPGLSNIHDERKNALTPEQLEAYGLLYNWAAASGRTLSSADPPDADGIGNVQSTTRYQGVCPRHWHLPSDNEWSQLEREIALNPGNYSTQNTPYTPANYNFFSTSTTWRPYGTPSTDTEIGWGRQMRSQTTFVDIYALNNEGTSFSRTEGGFDALTVGRVNDTNGHSDNYGYMACFWSSSRQSIYDVSRVVVRWVAGQGSSVARTADMEPRQYSVRCKKD
jgi:uncharacterized protein (TIGR02145 family)